MLASPPGSYNHWDYAIDHRGFAYLVGISLITGLLFGLAPATRLSRLDINSTLKEGAAVRWWTAWPECLPSS